MNYMLIYMLVYDKMFIGGIEMSVEDKLLTVKQVAERLGLAEITVRMWLVEKKIDSYKIGGSRRIPEREIERLKKGE